MEKGNDVTKAGDQSDDGLGKFTVGDGNTHRMKNFDARLKKLAEYCGRSYGNEMKLLVKGMETVFEEPEFPEGEEENKKKMAIWNKKYDNFIKDDKQYKLKKAMVYNIIIGMCDETVKNRLESHRQYDVIDGTNDVMKLIELIKDVFYDRSERKYAPMIAAKAVRAFGKMNQQDSESVLNYYFRFVSALEHVEKSYGEIVPRALLEEDDDKSSVSSLGSKKGDGAIDTTTEEAQVGSSVMKEDGSLGQLRDKFLVCMFLAGSNVNLFGKLIKDLEMDYARDGETKYPKNLEAALAFLQMCEGNKPKKVKEEKIRQSFANLEDVTCWHCKEQGHLKRDCPKKKTGSQNANVKKGSQFVGWQG
mmetsp:Transcript_1521/g.2238  ORF Transcript_1521/g.2238 Transcript_1521/m.2238 type:complete len:361 (-) Transcript_1521:175-1257(-)